MVSTAFLLRARPLRGPPAVSSWGSGVWSRADPRCTPGTKRGRAMSRQQPISCPCAGAPCEQDQQPTGDRQVLLEMQQLVAIAEFGVEQSSGRYAEACQQQGCGACLVAEQDQSCAPRLGCDGKWHELTGDAEGLCVGDRGRIARELAPGLVQE